MNVREIIEGCRRDGVALSVTDDNLVRYLGNEYSVGYWLPIIAENKPAIIAELSKSIVSVAVVRCCNSCRHCATPGRSAGYCAGREDLPPAYGINHPLRKLPADAGVSCQSWAPFDLFDDVLSPTN